MPNFHAGLLERRVRRVGKKTMPGFHGFCSFYPFGAILGVPLLHLTAFFFFYVASLRRCVRHAFCFSRGAAWPYRCVKIFCLTQRRNDATLIRVSGRRIAHLVEWGIIFWFPRSSVVTPTCPLQRSVTRRWSAGAGIPTLERSSLYTSPAKPKMPSFQQGCRNPVPWTVTRRYVSV